MINLKAPKKGPKILIYDIETAPILGYVWQLWDQNVALNQIKQDWYVMSWGAKWLNTEDNRVMYMDLRDTKDKTDDKEILQGIWNLLDEADIVVTQNGKHFDQKKLNARFIQQGFKPPKSYEHVDTLQIAKKVFGFTSNKLEYMADKLCTKYKKLKHEKFAGFELWKECISGNKKAWREMERYNKHDVLSLEELYTKLRSWDHPVNVNLYHDSYDTICVCGAKNWIKHGFKLMKAGKYQQYQCTKCGAIVRDRTSFLSVKKRKSLKV